jgi:uncharacterized protein DUF3300
MVEPVVSLKNPPDESDKAVAMKTLRRIVAVALTCMLLAPPLPASSQDASKPAFKPEELDQLVAPIALHPDPLLAQILMASTYPLEVVEAARFAKENAKLSPDQLSEAMKQKTWDDSVKSMVSFPQVIAMMNEKLDWLQKLGDAFLSQQQDVMAAVQRLRARAQATGQLKSSKEQNVIVEPAAGVPAPPAGAASATPPPGSAPPPANVQAPAPPTNVQVQQAPPTTVQVQQAPANVQVVQAPPTTTVIKIEPANPQVVYVPSYDPTVVYGGFPPAYPPYYPYPPGYFAAGAFMFGAGMAVGAAMWGDCDWDNGDVNVNNSNNNYNNFSNKVNNSETARNRVEARQNQAGSGGRGNWQHNPEHRKGVQYRDAKTQQRFNRTGPGGAQAREQFRGRTPSTQPAAGRGGGGVGGGAQAGTRDVARPSTGGGGQGGGIRQGGDIGGAGIGQGGATTRQAGAGGGIGQGGGSFGQGGGGIGQGGGAQGGRTGAFEGMGNGRATQSFSDRGNASRQSFQRSGGGGGGGGARAGGGGGGGGRGGGGGGGRGGGGRR